MAETLDHRSDEDKNPKEKVATLHPRSSHGGGHREADFVVGAARRADSPLSDPDCDRVLQLHAAKRVLRLHVALTGPTLLRGDEGARTKPRGSLRDASDCSCTRSTRASVHQDLKKAHRQEAPRRRAPIKGGEKKHIGPVPGDQKTIIVRVGGVRARSTLPPSPPPSWSSRRHAVRLAQLEENRKASRRRPSPPPPPRSAAAAREGGTAVGLPVAQSSDDVLAAADDADEEERDRGRGDRARAKPPEGSRERRRRRARAAIMWTPRPWCR